ncbi:MAG: biotin-dependent carboxyltransferase family protein [Candidatus Bathyarchaeota archaeon]|jgi:antagonist of KipI|nr:biotin-dependent carboxyltransferase family protein [Candidatus Bathyarchaeota archaeon]
MKLCRIIRRGLFTTIQDFGRYGFQRYGVPVSGAIDPHAFLAANLLVGNKPNYAVLEITLKGPELLLLNATEIAITGANLSPAINGKPVDSWQTLRVHEGDTLSFGLPKEGCRAYLAVSGGIDVPVLLGSRSTYVRGGFGGFSGRQLREGDIVESFQPEGRLESRLSLPRELIPRYRREAAVQVVLGPQVSDFTERGLDVFLASEYTMTTDSDRMGLRLEGPGVEIRDSAYMVSDATPPGSVQVPSEGKPIILLRDAQTTGGYPKIGVVTTPDISRLGQLRPHSRIRFSKISLNKAREKLLGFRNTLNRLHNEIMSTDW